MLACLLVAIFVSPILAIGNPDEISVNAVYVYRNCRETGDQLYIVDYSLNYTVAPNETITEAYLCRLMEGAEELRATAPFAYYNNGYDDGVVAIYFDAAEAPAWQGSYNMTLIGNPLLDWPGDPPFDTVGEFDVWQDNPMSVTKVIVAGRIIELAYALEASWGQDMVTTADTGKDVLTKYGAAYFINVIPYLFEIAPDIYAEGEGAASTVIRPEVPPDTSPTDYAEDLETNILGTPLDITPVADAFGVSRGGLTALLYYGVMAFALILIARSIGSYKPVMLFSIPLVVLGAFVGVPLIVTILAGLASLGLTSYVLFFKPSSA